MCAILKTALTLKQYLLINNMQAEWVYNPDEATSCVFGVWTVWGHIFFLSGPSYPPHLASLFEFNNVGGCCPRWVAQSQPIYHSHSAIYTMLCKYWNYLWTSTQFLGTIASPSVQYRQRQPAIWNSNKVFLLLSDQYCNPERGFKPGSSAFNCVWTLLTT